jgi:hypothetical protein
VVADNVVRFGTGQRGRFYRNSEIMTIISAAELAARLHERLFRPAIARAAGEWSAGHAGAPRVCAR